MDAAPTRPSWPNTRHGNRDCPNQPSFFSTVRTLRERDFGVARLWQELTRGHKYFEFLHGNGLGVLGIGESYPEPVRISFRLRARSRGN